MRVPKAVSILSLLVFLATLIPGVTSARTPPPPETPIPTSPGPPPEVDPQILTEMDLSANGTTGFFVRFRGRADLSAAAQIPDWKLRGRSVYEALRAVAERSQKRVRAFLDARGIPYRVFLTTNSIFVTGDKELLRELAAFPEVEAFRANYTHPLEPIERGAEVNAPVGPSWNIVLVGADRVWRDFGVRGDGITVANIDTGVEYTHPALFPNYKCGSGPHDDCWYDPSAICPPGQPCDNVGHGTHTMGTMVGDDDPTLSYNVGMAPNAQWIACKGCEDWSCSDFALNACADWILAPNGNPDHRPNVVNNSWGGGGCQDWYRTAVEAWRAAGIFPAFSAGNSGPGCGSLGSPGDYPESFASGASDADDQIAGFSSRGPSCWGEIKPEVAAPGVDVCSTVPGGGFECTGWSGTSMASPHSAGLVALLWSANLSLIGNIETTERLITSTAVCRTDLSCGGEECHNNVYGWGRIDAYAAVQLVVSQGYLEGYVRDESGTPLGGATILARRRTTTITGYTDPTGYYTMSLPAGTYTVTAALYGYAPQTVTGVEIITDTTTTQNFTLTAVPFYQVSGTVIDAGGGWPLYAQIAIQGDPISPPPPYDAIWTNPLDGSYSITLAAGITYTFHVRPWSKGYLEERRPVGPLTGNEVQNFALQVDAEACIAPGYRPNFAYYEDFEASDGDFKTLGSTSWAWGTPTSGPGSAHSGLNAWGTNLSGNYNNAEDGYLVSPPIDLSAYAGQGLYLSWWQWLQTEWCCDFASVEVSNDGGQTWRLIYGQAAGNVDLVWTRHWAFLDPSYAVADFRLRFRLYTDWSVTYPGFYIDDVGILPLPLTTVYSEDFEASNGGYTTRGNTSWEWGTPTSGPGSAHSGSNVWATNLEGNYGPNENGYLESPEIDLSAYAGQDLYLLWWQWLQTEYLFDYGSVEVSADGGATWQRVYGETSGNVDLAWRQRGAVLDPWFATEHFRLRFRLRSDRSVHFPGYYVDDVAIAVSPPVVLACNAQQGGLVLGNVYDLNNGTPLAGAWVVNDSRQMDLARYTPDPAEDDAFYLLFSPSGFHFFTATMAGGYRPDVELVEVPLGGVVRQDFQLAAGRLEASPHGLAVTLDMGLSTTLPLTLHNTGSAAAQFAARESDRGFVPAITSLPPSGEPFSAPAPVGPLSVRSAEGRAALSGMAHPLAWNGASPVPGGVVRYAHAQCPGEKDSFYVISGVDGSFRVTANTWRYDAQTDTWTPLAPLPAPQEGPIAVCDEGRIYVMGGGGTNQFYIYDIASDTWSAGPALPRNVWGAAAGVWNGRIYLIGGDDDFWFGGTSDRVDIYDIASGQWIGTGPSMPYPAFAMGFVQAGPYLYIVGGWNDNYPQNLDKTQRFNMENGTWEIGPTFTSARADMALAITSQYLYAIGGDANGGSPFDPSATVERLDWTAWPGGTWSEVGEPLPRAYTSNNAGYCTEARSGGEVWSVGGYDGGAIVGDTWYRPSEPCFSLDVPWLSVVPISGTVDVAGSLVLTVTFDAGVPEVDQPGNYYATLSFANDTPYGSVAVPVTLTVPAPASWGRLSGTVYSLGYCDAHTATLAAQILIESSSGQTWTVRTRQDGTYVRWLEAGTYTVTVSAPGHLPQTDVLALEAGQSVVHDVSLRLNQPCAILEPAAIEISLPYGTGTYTHPTGLTLFNRGAQELTFAFREFSGSLGLAGGTVEYLPEPHAGNPTALLHNGPIQGSLSRRPYVYHVPGVQQFNIIAYADDDQHVPTAVELALQGLGLPYTFYGYDPYGDNLGRFRDAVEQGGWDLVILAAETWSFVDASEYTAVQHHLELGGLAIVQSWAVGVDPAHQDHPLWALLGGQYAGWLNTPAPLYWWDEGHPLFNVPEQVPEFTDLNDLGYWAYGARMTLLGGPETGLGGFTEQPAEGQAGVILREDWTAIYKGLTDNLNSADRDADGKWDASEWWTNAVQFLLYPPSEVPWLWVDPISGTVQADSSVHVDLYVTGVLTEPLPVGTYTATLLLSSNDRMAGSIRVPVVLRIYRYRIYLPLIYRGQAP